MKFHRKEHVEHVVLFECFRTDDFDMREEKHLGQAKKFEDFELQELLDENPAQMLIEVSKALMLLQRPPQNACMPWKKFIKKRYGYHMSCQKMPS